MLNLSFAFCQVQTSDSLQIRFLDRRKGFTMAFEAHVRSVMACGCSARQARDNMLLNAQFMLPATLVSPYSNFPTPMHVILNPNLCHLIKADEFCNQVPDIAWFARQREAMGLEAMVYAFMAVGIASSFPSAVIYPAFT